MPFTPFHMGPGLLIKSILSRHFSLMVFGFSQVAMDIETAVHIHRGDPILHGFSHTYLGASIIALLSFLIGRPMCQWLLSLRVTDPNLPFFEWLFDTKVISKKSALLGAFIGTYSHVLLDSIMHLDVRPFTPWSESNPFLEMLSLRNLHLFCIATAALGTITIVGFYVAQKHKGS